MRKRILISIIASLLQTAVYLFVFFCAWHFGGMIRRPMPMTIVESVGFVFYVEASVFYFLFLVLISNATDAIVNERKWTIIILIAALVINLLYCGLQYPYTPTKAILFFITGLIAIVSKFPIQSILTRAMSV